MKFQDIFDVVWQPIKKIIIVPFWWVIVLIIIFSIPALKVWWWLLAPIILMVPLQTFYFWWIGWDHWYPNKNKWVILELTPPKEVLAPFSAMEDVFSTLWSVIDTANWREVWCDGELPKCPYWLSWEIASIEGEIHFYVRCLVEHRHVVESVLYSHYPDLEIKQVSDYTKNVPQNLPNEEWDIYGEDYQFGREDFYPIKTYSKFFEPAGERITKEEKRIDPITSMLEDMARIGPGEQVWFQMITTPISKHDVDWVEEAKKAITKLSRRPEKKKKSILEIIQEGISDLAFGILVPAGEEGERAISPARSEEGEKEMIITPGEREILSAIEEKIKKLAYKTNIRGLYVAKRSAFKGDHGKIVRAYFTHFAAQNLNHFRFSAKTRTKVHYFMRNKRKVLRQRKIFINYILRFPPLYPKMTGEINPIMNSEELATLFHFPTKVSGISVPTVVRVEAKKGGPPPDLPVE